MKQAAPFSGWERALALRYLRSTRSEAGLALVTIISVLAVTLTVAALVVVMSVMNGFRAELLDKMLGFNGHDFVQGGALTAEARDAMVARVRATPGVVEAIPTMDSQALVQGPDGTATGAYVRAIRPADLKRIGFLQSAIKRGSTAQFGEGEDGGDLVIVGQRLADVVGAGVGDQITLTSPSGGATAFGTLPTRKTYTIAATFSVGQSEYDQNFIYMPLNQAQLFFGADPSAEYIEVKLANPDQATKIKPALARAAGPGALVSDWTDKNKAFFQALQVERSAMRIIFLIVVALAALNIISGLVMLVKNKSRDIAVLRTMGASRLSIMRVFLMAGGAIGSIGTFMGLALGLLVCANIGVVQTVIETVSGVKVFNPEVYFLSHVPAKVDWEEVKIVTIFTFSASLIFTLLPAWIASRLDPVEALRYE